MTITVEETPNPHARKFLVQQTLSRDTLSYRTAPPPEEDALAAALFAVGPVVSVMILERFVTVNKKPNVPWSRLQPKILAALQQHLETHAPGPSAL